MNKCFIIINIIIIIIIIITIIIKSWIAGREWEFWRRNRRLWRLLLQKILKKWSSQDVFSFILEQKCDT